MNNKIKTEQVAMMLMLIVPVGKYLSLPSVLAKGAGRDYWISIILVFVVDFICFLAFMWALKLNTERLSIKDIFDRTIGQAAGKILFAIMFIYIYLRAAVIMESCLELFSVTFAIKTNWFAFIIPIAALSMFMARKDMNNFARLSEMLFVIIYLSFGMMLFLSSRNANFTNIKPILDDGFQPVLETALKNTFWFSDFSFMAFIMRDYKPEKKYALTLSGAYIAAMAVTVFMNILYIALFDQLAVQSQSVLSKVSQFSVKLTTSGRVDWLFVSIMLFTLFIKATLEFFCCNECLHYIFSVKKHKNPYWTNIAVALPMIIVPVFVNVKDNIFDLFSRDGYGFVFWIIQYGLPLFSPLMTYIANKKEKEKVIYPRRVEE